MFNKNPLSAFNAEGSVFRLKNPKIFEGLAKSRIYEKNLVIYRQGDEARYVYYLISGKAQI